MSILVQAGRTGPNKCDRRNGTPQCELTHHIMCASNSGFISKRWFSSKISAHANSFLRVPLSVHNYGPQHQRLQQQESCTTVVTPSAFPNGVSGPAVSLASACHMTSLHASRVFQIDVVVQRRCQNLLNSIATPITWCLQF